MFFTYNKCDSLIIICKRNCLSWISKAKKVWKERVFGYSNMENHIKYLADVTIMCFFNICFLRMFVQNQKI